VRHAIAVERAAAEEQQERDDEARDHHRAEPTRGPRPGRDEQGGRYAAEAA
jgi:hypothetical protein